MTEVRTRVSGRPDPGAGAEQVGLSPTRARFAEKVLADLMGSGMRTPSTVALVGEPGLGKTVLLGAIGELWVEAGGSALALGGSSDLGSFSTDRMLDDHSRAPVAILVDDLDQWDEASVGLLAEVVASSEVPGLTLVSTVANDVPDGLQRLQTRVIALPRLTEPEMIEVLTESGVVSAELQAAVVERSGGNPWVAAELAAAGATVLEDDLAGVPETVARRFHGVLGELPGPVRRFLAVLAAADSAELSLIDRAMGILGETVPDLQPAERAGIVEFRDGRISFTHPVLRTVSYRSVGIASRRAAHTALATVMSLPGQAIGRASHLVAASDGPDEAVAEALAALAASSASGGAHREAARRLERAAGSSVEPGSAASRLAGAAIQWRIAEEPAEVRRVLARVPRRDLDSGVIADLIECDRWANGTSVALANLAQSPPSEERLGRLLRAELSLAVFGSRVAAFEFEAESADGSVFDPSARLELVRDSTPGANPAGSVIPKGRWRHVVQLDAGGDLGMRPPLGTDFETLVATARDNLLRAELSAAERALDMAAGRRLDEALGAAVELCSTRALLQQVRGRSPETPWDSLEMGAEPAPARWSWAVGRAGLDGADESHLDHLRAAAELRPDLYGAEVVAALAAEAMAAEAAEWLNRIPEDTGAAGVAAVRRMRAEAIVQRDDGLFRGSAELAADQGLALDRFESLMAQAESLARRGQSEAAVKLAGLVEAAFSRLGVMAWQNRIRRIRELDRRPPLADSLTPAELRVAEAVAGGGTNKDVAAELFISVKTVDYHLQNIYRKLEIRSRTELAVIVSGSESEGSGG